MNRRKLYIPVEVKIKIKEYLESKYQKILEGYFSANEDEDVLIGDLGGSLRIRNQKVKVIDDNISGTWTWSINYSKLRGRGPNATEKKLGADGIVELELNIGERIEKKSVLFQAKNILTTDSRLLEQALLLTTWREAAVILNFSPEIYEVISIDSILRSGGTRSEINKSTTITEFLANDFLDCMTGDTDLEYDARKRILKWRAKEGIVVGTKFSIPHRIKAKINAPNSKKVKASYSKEISNEEIHNYRMAASDEEILALPENYTKNQLKKAKKEMALLYHPDKYNLMNVSHKELATRRMQEIILAFENLEKQRNKFL